MKKLLLSHSLFLIPYFLFSQNVGIGTTTPVTKLHVVSSVSNVATFSGASSMYITLAEGASNRGYIGSFAGNPEDVDFGTYGGNTTGKLHLTIQDIPKLTVEASGNIGIGTTDPLSLLHVTNGAILFDGATGTTPVSGTGTRFMWIPAKASLRIGKVTGNNWDDANIGINSFALGNTVTASGFNATALGSFTVASGDYSLAMGVNALATGYNAIATGGDTRASGTLSTAMGNNTTASGDLSAANGNNTTSKSFAGFVIGTYNDSSNAVSPVSPSPLNRIFQIGNGTADNARSNAMTVLQNGKVGIGTTTPNASATLDVSSSTGGFLFPRMTTAQRNAIASPAAGLQIYNTDRNCLEIWNSSGWMSFCDNGIFFNGVPINQGSSIFWHSKADFGGTSRYGAVGFSIGSKGYIGTGNDVSVRKKDFWEYDPATNVWTQKADFGGTARRDAVGFSIGSKGYIGTGNDISTFKKDFWEYDPATNVWTQKADFGGTAREYAVGFSIGPKGYIGTGYDGSIKKDFWEYDPGTNTWTQKTDFGGTAREGAIGFSIGSKGYIGTGNDGVEKKDFWEYDPGSNGWTQKTDFGGTGREFATGFSIGSKGYIGTGYDGANRKDFWEYDPASNGWTQKADFGGPGRQDAVGFSIGSKGYIGTGSDNISSRNDFWEYFQ